MTLHSVPSRAGGGSRRNGHRPIELPLVAVLPFRSQDDHILPSYFVDGMTREVIATLGRLPDLSAVAASSVLRYRGLSIDPRGAGHALGADFVVTGEIARIDQRLTFNQRLIDVAGGELIWMDSFEANIDALHDAEHWIVARVAAGLVPHLREFEIQRALSVRPRHLTAYDAMLRACDSLRSLTPVHLDEAGRLLDHAMHVDPTFSLPYAWAARVHSLRIGQGWARDKAAEAEVALALATKSIALDERNSLAMATCGHLQSFLFHRYDDALDLLDRAIEVCHSDALAWSLSSATLTYCGYSSEAFDRAMHAIRLSPMDQMIHQLYCFAALACYGCGNYADAQTWSRKSLAENPRYTSSHKILIASLVADGKVNEARDVAAELRRLDTTRFAQLAAAR